jgi:hypothetical protein
MNDGENIDDLRTRKPDWLADTEFRPRLRRRRIYFGERVERALLIFLKAAFAILFGMFGFWFGILGGALLAHLFGQTGWEIVGGVIGAAVVGLAVLLQMCLPRQ